MPPLVTRVGRVDAAPDPADDDIEHRPQPLFLLRADRAAALQVALLDEPEPGLHLGLGQPLQLSGSEPVQQQLQLAPAVN